VKLLQIGGKRTFRFPKARGKNPAQPHKGFLGTRISPYFPIPKGYSISLLNVIICSNIERGQVAHLCGMTLKFSED